MNGLPTHGKITGPIVMIGFGSIGKGTLPLIERHFEYDKNRFVVISPDATDKKLLDEKGIRFLQVALTPENYTDILTPVLTDGEGQGLCVNVSVDTSSVDLMRLCRELNTLYIDTVIEPWKGFYWDEGSSPEKRTNYYLRETLLAERAQNPGGTTAVSCCGANPGMVSWFVKQALMDLANTQGIKDVPKSRKDWALLMQTVGVKGIHIAERDTQQVVKPKVPDVFVNTWSVEGFLSEGLQPAELGWGTHEKWMPTNAATHKNGCQAGVYLEQPGAATRVRTWCPTLGAQNGFLVTHNEAISIADYFSLKGQDGTVKYRPTCHYAYHPCDDAVLSLHELFGKGGKPQSKYEILSEDDIVEGMDELGVLLYGHEQNAYWYGSQLSIEEARKLAPYQNATGLQVTSAILAGMVWALENPNKGIVEADEMDFQRCLDIQKPYLGPVKGYYTDWNPLQDRVPFFKEDIDETDPWQFKNILV